MANNYSETSFMIPCTQAQAKMACWCMGLLEEFDEDIRYIVEADEDHTFEYMWERMVKQFVDIYDEGSTGWIDGDWYTGFHATPDRDGIWMRSDESFNSNGADLFIQTVLSIFDLDIMVTYSVAETCSKKRVDEFGGYAVAITKDTLDSVGTYHWMQEQQRAFAMS